MASKVKAKVRDIQGYGFKAGWFKKMQPKVRINAKMKPVFKFSQFCKKNTDYNNMAIP